MPNKGFKDDENDFKKMKSVSTQFLILLSLHDMPFHPGLHLKHAPLSM